MSVVTAAVGRNGVFRSGRWFTLVGAALVLITIAASALTVWDLRTDAIANYRRDMKNLGIVMAEETARSLHAVDLVVQETQGKILASGVETPAQFSQLMASNEIHHDLRDRLKNLPQADAIILVAADGEVVNTSHSWPFPVVYVSERESLSHFREHDDLGIFMSAPVKSPTTGTWSIYLGRRLNGSNGEFLGFVQAAIGLRYFENFYAAVTLRDGGSVLLLRRDGTFLARYPRIDSQIGKTMPAESPWYARVEEHGGTYRSPGYLDGLVRVVSVHPLRDYPLIIDVTVAEDEALAHWRRQSTFIAIGALCAVAGFVVLFRLLAAQFRRLERSESSLAARNVDLERSHARLEEQSAEMIETAAALNDSQRMLGAIIDQIPAKISAKDRDLRYIIVNSVVAREFGCRTDEVAGKTRAEFPNCRTELSSGTAFANEVARRDLAVLETGRAVMNAEETVTHSDGSVEYLLSSKAPLFDANHAVIGVITVAVDITPQKRAEDERRSLERQLQHAQRIEALGQLAGGVAHDLNNALVPVLGLTELVLEGTPKDSGDRALLETVLTGARRARELVRQILTFSRREQPDRHVFDLSETAAETLKMLRAGIPSTIALVDGIAPALTMVGDPGQLQQVLTNLVMNAAQAIDDRHGTITVLAQREGDGAHIRLSVADTGCGMDAATTNHIFEPFFTTKEVGKGTGLGLSIVHGIVSTHGGIIAVESAPGQGTRFEIVLPTKLDPASSSLRLAS